MTEIENKSVPIARWCAAIALGAALIAAIAFAIGDGGFRFVSLLQAVFLFGAIVTVLRKEGWESGDGHALLNVIVLVGAALRLQGVDGFLVNPDEAMFLQTANRENLSDVFGTSLFHAHPPGSYYIYHVIGWFTRDVAWMRVPSLIAGIAMIRLGAYIAQELIGTRGAVVAAWLIAFSPGLIELSSVCRNYTLAFATILFAIWQLIRFLKDGNWRCFAWFAAGCLASFSFLYSMVIIVASLNAALAIYGFRERKKLAWWAGVVGAQIPSALVFLFYAKVHIARFSGLRAESYNTSWMEAQFSVDAWAIARNTLELFSSLVPQEIAIVYLALAIFGLYRCIYKREWLATAAIVLPFALAMAFLAIGKLPYGGTRHSLYLFAPTFAMAAYGLVELLAIFSASQARWARWFVVGLFSIHATISSIGALLFSSRDELPVRESEFWRAIETLEKNIGPNDFVVLDEQSIIVMSQHVPELASWYWEEEPRIYTRNGVRYCYIPHTRWYFKPPQFLFAIDRSREAFDLAEPDRIWTVFAGWEEQEKLFKQIEKEAPEIEPIDTGFESSWLPGSRPLLFAVRESDLERIEAAFPAWEISDSDREP